MTTTAAVETLENVVSAAPVAWHELAFRRVADGIAEQWDKALEPEHQSGINKWFKSNHAQKYQALQDCEDRINALWLEGRADEKSKDEFNAQLRIYRNGQLWVIEKFVAWKKEQASVKPAQGAMKLR